jgi:hypothetical protein
LISRPLVRPVVTAVSPLPVCASLALAIAEALDSLARFREKFRGPARPCPDASILHAFTTLLDRMRSEPVGFEQLPAASVWEPIAVVLSAARGRETCRRRHDLVRRAKLILGSRLGTERIAR